MTSVEASRLWYRCGFKLSQFALLSQPLSTKPVTASTFVETIEGIVGEEEKKEKGEREEREEKAGDKVRQSDELATPSLVTKATRNRTSVPPP